ncbi:carbohydrate binding domain-containing protein [Athalassotoga saccharophila]|uniref:carbohydrate binding domain-containing protein n=1 Tax=Athalassotoga saccharophila TaxID=1441386 RepID=UPI00137B12DF|nr:hypothetical protein [Athalassotoga saccharophila]BBJ28157.1 hypothetical protein ATHSA_1059 [Athalassotoga saccharophila]
MKKVALVFSAILVLAIGMALAQVTFNYYIIEPFSSPFGHFGLGPWTGGTSSATDASAQIVSSTLFGNKWDIYYNVEKDGSYNGTYVLFANQNLNQSFDASAYSSYVFFAKSDSSTPITFKVELKSPNNGVEYYYVRGIGKYWTFVQIPFKDFTKYSWSNETNFSQLTQGTFVFEHNLDVLNTAHLYIADIGFMK